MKTITMDYDLYEQELKTQYAKGKSMGVWLVKLYIDDPETYKLDDFEWERKNLQESLAKKYLT